MDKLYQSTFCDSKREDSISNRSRRRMAAMMHHTLSTSSLGSVEDQQTHGPKGSEEVPIAKTCHTTSSFNCPDQSMPTVPNDRLSSDETLQMRGLLADRVSPPSPTPSAEFEGDHLSHIAQPEDTSFSTASLQILQSLNEENMPDAASYSVDCGSRTQTDKDDKATRRQKLKAALILRKQNQQEPEESLPLPSPCVPQHPSLQLQLVNWMQAMMLYNAHQWVPPPRKPNVSQKEYLSPQLLAEVSSRQDEYTFGKTNAKPAAYLPFIMTGSR